MVGTIGVAAAQIGAGGRPAVEPGSFLVTGEDNLRINSWCAVSGVVLTIAIRFLTDKGEIVPYVYTHVPNSNRTKATSDFPLGVGFPLNIQIFASTGAPILPQCFVQAQIIRGFGGATTALATILQGPVTAVQTLGWPGSPLQMSTEGQGALISVTGTDPAAGVEISETVPAGARRRIVSIAATLVTSAAVANRTPILLVDDGAAIYFRSPANINQPATNTDNYVWARGMPIVTLVNNQAALFGIFQEGILLAGHRFRTATQNLDVGDNWTAPQYLVEEWLEAAA